MTYTQYTKCINNDSDIALLNNDNPQQIRNTRRICLYSEDRNAERRFDDKFYQQNIRNSGACCHERLQGKQYCLEEERIQEQETDTEMERTISIVYQQRVPVSGASSVVSIGHTQCVVEDVRFNKIPDKKHKQALEEVKIKSATDLSKIPVFISPPKADRNISKRIKNISKNVQEMKTELRRVCEKAKIPLRDRPEKRMLSFKRKRKSVYVIKLADKDQSFWLEPTSKTNVGHKKDKDLVENLKFSLKKAKQWTIIHKGDHFKERKRRKRTRERKVKSAIIKAVKKNWRNTKITEKRLDQDGKKMSVKNSKLKDIIQKWHVQPDTLSIHVYPVSRSLDQYFQSVGNGNTNTSETHMEIEWLRLNSFANLSQRIAISPILLAKAGFYYTGQADQVQCFSCGLTYQNWRLGYDPYRLHRSMSPTCNYVTGNDDTNVPIQREEEATPIRQIFQNSYGAEPQNERLDTLPENPSLHEQEARLNGQNTGHETSLVQRNLAQSSGNMFINNGQVLPIIRSPNDTNTQRRSERQSSIQESSPYQRQELVQETTASDNAPNNQNSTTLTTTNGGGNRPNDQTTQVHERSNRSNQLLTNGMMNGSGRSGNTQTQGTQQRSDTNVSTATMRKLAPLGVNFDKPKYPAYAVLPVRMSSYNGWTASQTPKLMAEAGFVFAGYSDYTRCFFCGGGLRNWEMGDDPWVEHARWFPKCAYLRQNKGVEFIQLVQEQLDREEGNQPNTVQTNDNKDPQNQTKEIEDIRSLPAYQSLTENGYNPEMVSWAVRNLRQKGTQTIDAIAIVDEIQRLEEAGEQQIDDVTNGMDDDVNGETSGANVQDPIDQQMKEIQALMEENRKLKKERMCRICEEEDASIAFLPCAHLVCCHVCSQAVRRCPVCGHIIQGTVKTWLG